MSNFRRRFSTSKYSHEETFSVEKENSQFQDELFILFLSFTLIQCCSDIDGRNYESSDRLETLRINNVTLEMNGLNCDAFTDFLCHETSHESSSNENNSSHGCDEENNSCGRSYVNKKGGNSREQIYSYSREGNDDWFRCSRIMPYLRCPSEEGETSPRNLNRMMAEETLKQHFKIWEKGI